MGAQMRNVSKHKVAKSQVDFAAGDFVVYPTHGVGKIVGLENQQIAGYELQVFVIDFEKDRMTLRVPIAKAKTSGLRRLSSRKEMHEALGRLKGRSRVRRTMWSRRAQEYEAKINSGDPASIAFCACRIVVTSWKTSPRYACTSWTTSPGCPRLVMTIGGRYFPINCSCSASIGL